MNVSHEDQVVNVCQDPMEIYSRLLHNHTIQGELVLDCFAGSGTCSVAALMSGRNVMAIEPEQRQIDGISARIEEVQLLLQTVDDVGNFVEVTPETLDGGQRAGALLDQMSKKVHKRQMSVARAAHVKDKEQRKTDQAEQKRKKDEELELANQKKAETQRKKEQQKQEEEARKQTEAIKRKATELAAKQQKKQKVLAKMSPPTQPITTTTPAPQISSPVRHIPKKSVSPPKSKPAPVSASKTTTVAPLKAVTLPATKPIVKAPVATTQPVKAPPKAKTVPIKPATATAAAAGTTKPTPAEKTPPIGKSPVKVVATKTVAGEKSPKKGAGTTGATETLTFKLKLAGTSGKVAGKRKRSEAETEHPVVTTPGPAHKKPKSRGRPKQRAAPVDIFPPTIVESQDDGEMTHDEATDDSGNESEFDESNWDFRRRGGKLLPPSFANVKKQEAAMAVYSRLLGEQVRLEAQQQEAEHVEHEEEV